MPENSSSECNFKPGTKVVMIKSNNHEIGTVKECYGFYLLFIKNHIHVILSLQMKEKKMFHVDVLNLKMSSQLVDIHIVMEIHMEENLESKEKPESIKNLGNIENLESIRNINPCRFEIIYKII